ncbi:Uncharacterized protein PECH_008233 [Penicillium ucsense]|uniref:Uncharacterized protein n=1 Tax=Penicillium ucsense TaxID=2839758 RepID=A0A8J8W330_9EURO|nr:Uncharacterized protein PECM_005295 [Penicillium ucsense]KAF7734357.1 Uncharacterized protein PECH_008233 [Penicillium ucsense]
MTSPVDAFQQLVDLFDHRGDQVLEIEIIPPSLGSSFLKDGCAVGISKKALIQAYMVARRVFFETCISMSSNELVADLLREQSSSVANKEKFVTEIMLLFDCEHLTAANWRKCRILAALSQHEGPSIQTSQQTRMLKTELTLLQSYQCSPLPRHTKSPTLWSHRLWTLEHLINLMKLSVDTLLDLQRHELEVVLRAAELHPRNYYAFTYARHLRSLLVRTAATITTESISCWELRLAKALLSPVLDWCLAHPRDISGWSFGLHVLGQCEDRQSHVEAVKRVLQFALDVGWEGESLWTFVDQAVRRFDLEDTVVNECLPLPRTLEGSGAVAEDKTAQASWRAWLSRAQAHWTACKADRS